MNEQQPICPLRCRECGVEYETGFNEMFCTEYCANKYLNDMAKYKDECADDRP